MLGSTGLAAVDATDLARFLARPESEGGAGLASALALDGGSSAQLWIERPAVGEPELVVPGVPVPNLVAVVPTD